ncbi:MAG: methylthioribulose 1-phosphate dehydratase [Xanthomonadaceae bacterium]|nr:methylthioribulose 1-phosphate dehydratase [Xanthomonadaceae bacterium]MDE1957982.1 methylthioribulose 1-phosphate dehydratase [Xanthomonadaceae bacterium]MDE2178062.1 methylthioribulose 1-phosphate dehydratase [Xanthomonadaceae bacterium]MDE2246214.1 methylthioribulose 1-phosphate dehydratase [Xanthomonadaceae bacterium]
MSSAAHSTRDDALLRQAAAALVAAGHQLAARGWTPATSSNFSVRIDDERVAITVSGRDKGRLETADIMLVDTAGKALDARQRPSAETALHLQIYRRFADVGAILHTHSRTQTVASRLYAHAGSVRLEGWELQKAISGHTTHATLLELPVFANTQHMPDLVSRIDAWLDAGKPLHGYLIDGHGLYAWGRDLAEAMRHLEALDFLLGCELDLRRLSP